MKVIFLIDSLGPGGAERSTSVLAPALVAKGLEVQVVTLDTAHEGFEHEVRAAGVKVSTLTSTTCAPRIRELRHLLRSERPDVLHTALFLSDQIGRLAAFGTSTKVVSSWVNTPRTRHHTPPGVPGWKMRLVNLIDAFTGHLFVDRFHAVTPGVARLCERAYRIDPAKVSVIERGRDIDGSPISPSARMSLRHEIGIGDEESVIFAAGRLEHQKAHVDLVRALPMVLQRHTNTVLVIAGRDGNASAQVRQAIATHPEVAARVRLLGHRSDVLDLLRVSDVMALPSKYEGTAGIALEAMALGTPIVSTTLEGMEGVLVDDVNALLVPVGDPQAMASGITRILSDPALRDRLARAGRDDFIRRFTLERCAERMIIMYSDLMANPSR